MFELRSSEFEFKFIVFSQNLRLYVFPSDLNLNRNVSNLFSRSTLSLINERNNPYAEIAFPVYNW